MSFTGALLNGHVDLNWQIAAGSNAASFVVERSNDGTSYQAIAQVEALHGDLQEQYKYVDESPVSGASASTEVSIYPNPVGDKVTINTNVTSHATVTILNTNGQVLQSASFEGQNSLTMDVSGYAPGIYLLHLINGTENITRKFIKK